MAALLEFGQARLVSRRKRKHYGEQNQVKVGKVVKRIRPGFIGLSSSPMLSAKFVPGSSAGTNI
jgi:hypothetical protein